MSLSPLLTSREVAAILRVNVRTVQRLAKYRRIHTISGLGRHLKFRSESVEQFIRDMEALAAKPVKPFRVDMKNEK